MYTEKTHIALTRAGKEVVTRQVNARAHMFRALSDAVEELLQTKYRYAIDLKKLPYSKNLPGFWQRRKSVKGTVLEPIAQALMIMELPLASLTVGAVIDALSQAPS